MVDIVAGEDVGVASNEALKPQPETSPVDLVIFDCDGVLVDSEPLAMRVLLQTLAERGLDLDYERAVDLFLGRSMQTISGLLQSQYNLNFGQDALEEVRLRLYDLFRAELQPIAGIAAAIEALDTRICVASSSQPERIELSLRVAGLLDRLHPHLFSATMVKNGKPAPDLFLFAAAQMGVTPDRCLVVEDSPAGIEAAKRADMRVLAFTGGGHAQGKVHRAKVEQSGADQVFEHMHQLNGLIAKMSSGET